MLWVSPMKKTARRALVENAGQVYTIEQELAQLRRERVRLDERILRLERKLVATTEALDEMLARATRDGGQGLDRSVDATTDEPLTPGKLPHRVLERIRLEPAKIHTAATLAGQLSIRDVQQVRTALARLVAKGLIRRAGVKGEFTI
jgi:hypothetical protein